MFPFFHFVENPAGCAVIAMLFSILFVVVMLRWRQGRSEMRVLVIMALAPLCWWSYAVYELLMVNKGYNIRIDLFLIEPVLLIVSVLSVLFFFDKR